MDTETPPYCNNLGGWSKGFLPTLTEATFRPLSPHCCSFTAVIWDGCDRQGVSFGQLARLIENIGYIGKIDDFTIKPRQQHSFFLTGFSRHTSSRLSSSGTTLSTTAETDPIHDDASSILRQYSRALDTGAVARRGSEPASSDDDGSLSDSDPDPSSDDDRSSSEDEQGRSSTRKNTPWDVIDEQRLLAYEKEDKSWSWIFQDSGCSTHALEHDPAPSRIGFLAAGGLATA